MSAGSGEIFTVICAASKINGETVNTSGDSWQLLQSHIDETAEVFQQIRHIEKDLIGRINYRMERLRLDERGLELRGRKTEQAVAELDAGREQLQQEYQSYTQQLADLYAQLNKVSFTAELADGQSADVPLSKVVRAYRPNAMDTTQKLGFYFEKLWEFCQ